MGEYTEAYRAGSVATLQHACRVFFITHRVTLQRVTVAMALLAYVVYFVVALTHDARSSRALYIITALVAVFCMYYVVKSRYGKWFRSNFYQPIENKLEKNWRKLQWLLYPVLIAIACVYVCLSVIKDTQQIQSLVGIISLTFIVYYFSKHRAQIRWRPVVWGFALQFTLGIIVLRWQAGYDAIKWLSDQIVAFFEYTYEGAGIVYGDPFMALHNYVFMGLSMMIFFSAVISMLFYLGLIQWVVIKVSWVFQITMGTTAIESINATSNIFLNGLDTVMMLYPYLAKLTDSEYHCFTVSNHTTIAGFVFGLFVLFGAPPEHILSAAVMSAPAGIAISKLSYPETEKSSLSSKEQLKLGVSSNTSVIEAGVNGANLAGKTVMTVVVNFIAFVSLLELVDTVLEWGGSKVGYHQLSYKEICSFLFAPLSFIIGVEMDDCREVARLIGTKIFTSELLAFQDLGDSIRNNRLSDRSATIATYALSGFSGITTISIGMGVWTKIMPSMVDKMRAQILRAFINANIACFITAAIAGLLYDPEFASQSSGFSIIDLFFNFPLGYFTLKDLL